MAADWEMRFPLDMIPAQLAEATPIALQRAADAVLGVAKTRTPTAPDSGHLRNSGGATTVNAGVDSVSTIKFEGPYAAYQNRGMRADGTYVIRNRPAGGQTGFLTETMVDQRELAMDVIADTIWQLLG